MPPLLATSSGALHNLTDRWRTLKTTPSVVREGGKIKISLSGGTWQQQVTRTEKGAPSRRTATVLCFGNRTRKYDVTDFNTLSLWDEKKIVLFKR